MAIFRQYNIQLLPLDTQNIPEAGITGYKNLFEAFKKFTSNAYTKKHMAIEAKPLANDTYICPFVVHIEDKYAYGKFLKYHKAETVIDFYSQKRLFEAKQGDTAVSNTHYFNFIFDYEFHRFAIEENNSRLPSPEIMKDALIHFLENLASVNFPKHTLTINLVSDQSTLRDVLAEGNEYGTIDVKVSFPNSRQLNDTLKEMRDLNAHTIHAHVAPARGARMTGIPNYIKQLVQSAANWGEAKIVFFKALPNKAHLTFKKMIYSTSENPAKFTLRQTKSEDEFAFIKRVWMNLKARTEDETK